MARTIIWASCIAICVSAIAYSTALYNIEDTKQAAFMMKVCTDAGGDWKTSWNNRRYCERPKH